MQKNLVIIRFGQIAQQHPEHVNKLANVKATPDIVSANAKKQQLVIMLSAISGSQIKCKLYK